MNLSQMLQCYNKDLQTLLMSYNVMANYYYSKISDYILIVKKGIPFLIKKNQSYTHTMHCLAIHYDGDANSS